MPQDVHNCHECGAKITTENGFQTHYCEDCKLEQARDEHEENHAEISEAPEDEDDGDGVFDKLRRSLPF